MIAESQRLRVLIEFEYDAEIFEGDPDDAFEIAKLEQDLALSNPQDVLPLILDGADITRLEVTPVLVEEL